MMQEVQSLQCKIYTELKKTYLSNKIWKGNISLLLTQSAYGDILYDITDQAEEKRV